LRILDDPAVATLFDSVALELVSLETPLVEEIVLKTSCLVPRRGQARRRRHHHSGDTIDATLCSPVYTGSLEGLNDEEHNVER
jgi:hypothetical protein